MPDLSRFTELLARTSQFLSPEKLSEFPIVVAVSGGADSVALLRILLAIQQKDSQSNPQSNLIVAHINHGLRGADSDGDELFTKELAAQFNLRFVCKRLADKDLPDARVACDYKSSEMSNSTANQSEESLRDSRYKLLGDIARETGARYIATGHTFDDQVETVLFRIFRGTGIGGLAGIPPVRILDETISIVRPLLEVHRSEIEAYMRSIDQPYRDDATNSESDYNRNFIRNKILPLVRERFGSVDASVYRLARQASEETELIHLLSDQLKATINNQSVEHLEIDSGALQLEPIPLIRHFVLRIWKQQHWPRDSLDSQWLNRIAEALVTRTKSDLNLPGDVRLVVENGIATFTQASKTK